MTYTYTQAPPIPKHRPQEPKKYPTLSIKKVCAMIEERCGSVRITERHGRECGNYAVIPVSYTHLESRGLRLYKKG